MSPFHVKRECSNLQARVFDHFREIKSVKKLREKAKCLKYSVFAFNFIFFIAGVLLLTCGFMAMKMSSDFTKIIESVEQLSLVNKGFQEAMSELMSF